MFNQLSQQLKNNSDPVNKLYKVNAKTLENLSLHQTELFTGLLSDSVKYVESVTHQTEVRDLLAANAQFAQSFRDRVANASKGSYAELNTLRDKVTEVMKSSFEATSAESESVVAEATENANEVVEATTKTAQETATKAEESVQQATKDNVKATEQATVKTAEATEAATQNVAENTKAVAEKMDSTTKKTASRTKGSATSTTKPSSAKSSN